MFEYLLSHSNVWWESTIEYGFLVLIAIVILGILFIFLWPLGDKPARLWPPPEELAKLTRLRARQDVSFYKWKAEEARKRSEYLGDDERLDEEGGPD